MNKFLRIIGIAAGTMFGTSLYAQVCNPAGNIVVFSNYDGGTLNINVDVNIPNLKIGIVSYETVQVNLSGPFVGNITGVEYAGYNTPSTYCSPGIATTVFSGVPVTVTPMIRFLPAATISDPDGWSSIVAIHLSKCTIIFRIDFRESFTHILHNTDAGQVHGTYPAEETAVLPLLPHR
jgi:hypothetical protein